jgi:hypothetical protein
MLNFMFRLSVSSESDREREEDARRYFDEHGECRPDEAEHQGRKWVLAPGVVTYEQEQAELAARRAAAARVIAEDRAMRAPPRAWPFSPRRVRVALRAR